jgi:putative membrane protein
MKRMGMHAAAFVAVVSLAACAPADDPGRTVVTDDRAAAPDRLTGDMRETQEFVQRAVEKNMAEIELGRLAQGRATDPQVREFAQMMVQDHTESLSQLRQSAQRANITFTERLSDDAVELRQRLQGLSGAEFDREYMQAMVEAHEEMHDLVEDRADRVDHRADAGIAPERPEVGTTGEDPARIGTIEVDRWASSTLPTVERHHQRAQEIRDRLDNGATARR